MTKEENRKIWVEVGLPSKKADSWFNKQVVENWTMPDGKKILKPKVIAKKAAEALWAKMSDEEKKVLKVSSPISTSTVTLDNVTKAHSNDDQIREMFRLKMEGEGWVSEDGNPIIDRASYLTYLRTKWHLIHSKGFEASTPHF